MLLGSSLVNGRFRSRDPSTGDVGSLPNEILKQFTVVLGEHETFRLVDDIAYIFDELMTLRRKTLGRIAKSMRGQQTVQRDIALVVLWVKASALYQKKTLSVMLLIKLTYRWHFAFPES